MPTQSRAIVQITARNGIGTNTPTSNAAWGIHHANKLLDVLASDRMCRFPASGSSRKSFARGCVPMDDPGCWQWVTREEAWAAVTLCNS